MSAATFTAQDLAGTHQLANALASSLPAESGAVIALDGPLGAGKTHFVQGVAAALGFDPANVTSPTFVMINEYPAARPIYHFDAYRIRDDDEFLELGVDEYFQSPGVCLVEWASRVSNCMPRELLDIEIHVVDEHQRRFEVQAKGEKYEAMLAAMAEQVQLQPPEQIQ